MPQDDQYGTLQFAWTGGQNGAVEESTTFNAAALQIVTAVGRNRFWTSDPETLRLTRKAIKAGQLSDFGPYKPSDADKPDSVPYMLAFSAFTQRPCKWYYVELVEGQYDDDSDENPTPTNQAALVRSRIEAGHPCPREGWWLSPAKEDSRRYFKAGDLMPDFGRSSDYGETIWQWDADQSAPRL